MKLLIIISHQLNGFRMTANDVSQLLGFQVAIALIVFINIKNREYLVPYTENERWKMILVFRLFLQMVKYSNNETR